MRNLSLTATTYSLLPNTNISSSAIDLDDNVLYVASESLNPDGELNVELWKIPQMLDGIDKKESPVMFSMFMTVAASGEAAQILNLRIVSEVRRICAITRGGDIVMISIDEEEPSHEVEGSVDAGILAASWSPDESLLALITGEGKLIIMTSTFEVLSEAPLDTTDFGEDAPINVGWGSKQTQFHGSLGKSAAKAPAATLTGSSPDDDGLPRISWRGDGALFVVSSLAGATASSLHHRVLRVYDRQGALQSTSEAVAGLEHVTAWRPSGNLIVGTQRFGFEGGGAGREGRHDVVFFERNGLRHGEFSLRVDDLFVTKNSDNKRKWGYKVQELVWSSDSNILGVWIKKDAGDIVQLWTSGNYHWYLKHEISAPLSASGEPGYFTSVQWHPELASCLTLTTPVEVIQRTYSWDTCISSSPSPDDSGSVAVFDGSDILLTPFRTQNVPPPMSSTKLTVSASTKSSIPVVQTPVYASFSRHNDCLAVLWETGYLEIWSLHTRLGPGREKVMSPVKCWDGFIQNDSELRWRQVDVLSVDPIGTSWSIRLLGSDSVNDVVLSATKEVQQEVHVASRPLPYRNCRLMDGAQRIYQAPTGDLLYYDNEGSDEDIITSFDEFCVQAECVEPVVGAKEGELAFYVGLGTTGKLYITAAGKTSQIVSSNATSFTVASGFIIFTNSAHEAIFIPFAEVPNILARSAGTTDTSSEWHIRKVERGSRIVVAVPSTMSLVLQMPRGNLETINPRPFVMEVVNQDLDAGNYRKAFFACRKHRIDLNVIVNHNQEVLLGQISSFVEQIHEVDHLNLFLTLIGQGSQSPETIAKLCDAIRINLESKDLKKYVNSILTAHVVKTPPDYEAGLALLLRLKDTDPDLVEDAVKYIIFLVDANRLFDIALGMYDFSLVLMIAQHAQKDPREYLPFLRELRALDKFYQRFRIDDHLRKYEGALRNLSLAGPERFEEAVRYIEQHQLYNIAMQIWKNTDQYEAVVDIYGDWLFERREFAQAAAAFIEANKLRKAMVAHEKAHQWQELFDLATRTEVSEEDLSAMGYRVAEDLSSKKRYAEAGRVLLDYAKDVREAVVAFVQGNWFSEARRIASLNSKLELTEEIIHPAALESCAQMSEDIGEMREQLRKQLNRVRELHIKKVEEPDAFYGTEPSNLQNIDVMTDVSMAPTAFTRYTVAPTTASRSSRRTSRSRRKTERKIGSGRKGTIDEEEYLLKSITKLVERFRGAEDEAGRVLPHMPQFTLEHRSVGTELQEEITEFETEFKEALDEIWAKPAAADGEGGGPAVDSWQSRMDEHERNKQISPIDKVPKPDLAQNKSWRLNLFDLKL